MIDRHKIVAVLRKRFPAATSDQVAAAASAIVDLNEWQEVTPVHSELSHLMIEAACQSEQFRIFRRRATE